MAKTELCSLLQLIHSMCAAVHLNIQAFSGPEHMAPVLLMYKSTFDYPHTRRSNAIYRCSENITLRIHPQ
jgi:hypothetical protein